MRELSGQITITAADDEKLIITPNPVPFDANNNQKINLDIKLRNGDGYTAAPFKGYVKVIVQQGYTKSDGTTITNTLGTHILNAYNSTTKMYTAASDFSYKMTSSRTTNYEYGKANQYTIEVYDNNTTTSAFPAASYLVHSEVVCFNRDKPDFTPIVDAWNASRVYNNGDYLIDGDMIYVWKYPIASNTTSSPKVVCQNDNSNAYWDAVQKQAYIATKVLFADQARIADFIFKKESDGSGSLKSADKDADGNPNLYMNTKTGWFSFQKGAVGSQLYIYPQGISSNAQAYNITNAEVGKVNFNVNRWMLFYAALDSNSRSITVKINPFYKVPDEKAIFEVNNGGSEQYPNALYIKGKSEFVGDVKVSGGTLTCSSAQLDDTKVNGLRMNIRKVTASTTLSVTDDYVLADSSSAITITLPSISSILEPTKYNGKVIKIRKTGSGNITIAPYGSTTKILNGWSGKSDFKVNNVLLGDGAIGEFIYSYDYDCWISNYQNKF